MFFFFFLYQRFADQVTMAKAVDCLFLWIQFYWIIAIINCLYIVCGYFCTTKATMVVVKRFHGLQSLTYLCDLSWRNISRGHLHLLLQDVWGFSYLQSRVLILLFNVEVSLPYRQWISTQPIWSVQALISDFCLLYNMPVDLMFFSASLGFDVF